MAKELEKITQQLSYVTNLALAYRRAVLEQDAKAAAEYEAKIHALADGQPNAF